VVKLSAFGASPRSNSLIGRLHYQIEKELEESGMAWTMLRPHHFSQNQLSQATNIIKDGVVYSSSGDGKIPFVDTRDIAACAAVALTRPGHDGQKYIPTGLEALSHYDTARILSDVIGRPVEYYDRFDEGRDRNTLAPHQRAGGKTAIVHDTVPDSRARSAIVCGVREGSC
jgi:uncharacterized protein YbjT (DUF2867 family)